MGNFLGKNNLLRLTNRVLLKAWKKLERCFIFLPLSSTLKLRNGWSVSTWKLSHGLSKHGCSYSMPSGQSSISLSISMWSLQLQTNNVLISLRYWKGEKGSSGSLHSTEQSPLGGVGTNKWRITLAKVRV